MGLCCPIRRCGCHDRHSAAVAFEPVVARTCGGGEPTRGIGVGDVALAIAVAEAGADQGVKKPNAVLTSRQLKELTTSLNCYFIYLNSIRVVVFCL